KHCVLSFKPQRRLEWRGQDGQNETEQPDHSASLGDSITASTRIRFSVHTGLIAANHFLGLRFEERRYRKAILAVGFRSSASSRLPVRKDLLFLLLFFQISP
ncbi:MAG: hypothetical protein WBF73_34225, partial [Bradyrhizobium sp.]